MITYPVGPDDRFVAYNVSTLAILTKPVRWPRKDGMPVEVSDPTVGIAQVIVNPKPTNYDPDTHKLEKQEALWPAQEAYYITWKVVPLTQEELDAVAERKADEALQQQIRAAYLDLKNGVGTALERLARDEKATAWLLKQYALGNGP